MFSNLEHLTDVLRKSISIQLSFDSKFLLNFHVSALYLTVLNYLVFIIIMMMMMMMIIIIITIIIIKLYTLYFHQAPWPVPSSRKSSSHLVCGFPIFLLPSG